MNRHLQALLVVCLALSVRCAAAENEDRPWQDADPKTFEQSAKAEGAVILDVRSSGEFKAGHIPKAVHINVSAEDFLEQAGKLDKDKPVLVYCATGVRSVKACEKLAEAGFKKLVNLEGGFKAWDRAGKPVE